MGTSTNTAMDTTITTNTSIGNPAVDGSVEGSPGSVVGNEMYSETRFGMLETIREFSTELLQNTLPSEAEQIYRYRAEYFLTLAERGWVGMQGHEQELWMERLEVEQANLQSVMKRAVEQRDGEMAMHLGAALWMVWGLRDYNNEGVKWLREAFGMPGAEVRNQARAMALLCAASVSFNTADFAAARYYSEETVAILRELGSGLKRELGIALSMYGFVLAFLGELEAARAATEEGVKVLRQAGDKWGLSFALFIRGLVHL